MEDNKKQREHARALADLRQKRAVVKELEGKVARLEDEQRERNKQNLEATLQNIDEIKAMLEELERRAKLQRERTIVFLNLSQRSQKEGAISLDDRDYLRLKDLDAQIASFKNKETNEC